MTTHFKRYLFCISYMLFLLSKLAGQDLLDYSNSKKYAEYLFEHRQYRFSAIEYERISFLAPNDTLAKLRLIQSYRLMNDFKTAKLNIDRFFPEVQFNYPEIFALENFRILFLDQQYQDCNQFLIQNKTIQPSRKIEYQLGTLLMQYRWNEAKTLSEDYLLSHPTTVKLDDLYSISTKGIDLRPKNPYFAAFLSGIVPGSGKIYTSQWKDGVYAFLITSSFAWFTYQSLKNKGLNGGSILLGSVAFSFYTANIFGSYKSAIKYNNKQKKHLTKDIEQILFDDQKNSVE